MKFRVRAKARVLGSIGALAGISRSLDRPHPMRQHKDIEQWLFS